MFLVSGPQATSSVQVCQSSLNLRPRVRDRLRISTTVAVRRFPGQPGLRYARYGMASNHFNELMQTCRSTSSWGWLGQMNTRRAWTCKLFPLSLCPGVCILLGGLFTYFCAVYPSGTNHGRRTDDAFCLPTKIHFLPTTDFRQCFSLWRWQILRTSSW